RVRFDFGLRRGDRVAGEEHEGRMLRRSCRPMAGRTRRVAAAFLYEFLDDAVLERMEPHNREPAARLQELLCSTERTHEFLELAIDVDAQSLKGPRRRMDGILGLSSDDGFDEPGQLAGAREGFLRPRPGYGPG